MLGELHGERLSRVPRGYPANHPAAEYLKLNPNGLIPVLIDGDLVLYETAAICRYVDEAFGRFLRSARGPADKEAYLRESFAGIV